MIYSKDDVKRILALFSAQADDWEKQFPKSQIYVEEIRIIVKEIESSLKDPVPNVCKAYGGAEWCRNGPGCCGDC